MGQPPCNVGTNGAVEKAIVPEDQLPNPIESDEVRSTRLDRLQAEIAAGTYSVSAETLVAKLVRRIR